MRAWHPLVWEDTVVFSRVCLRKTRNKQKSGKIFRQYARCTRIYARRYILTIEIKFWDLVFAHVL